MGTYKDLHVWQRSVQLCVDIYKATENFPKSEFFGIVAQIRRASVSISSNIAEGYRRGGDKEFIQYLRVAYGSGAELETQITIANKIGYLKSDIFARLNSDLDVIMKMLHMLIYRVQKNR